MVSRCGRDHVVGERHHIGGSVDRHAGVAKRIERDGKEGTGDVAVHQQRLDGIADAGSLGFRVQQHGDGFADVGGGVHVDVTVPGAGLDHRHLRPLDHGVDQPGPASRDQHIHQAPGGHHLSRDLASPFHQGDGVGTHSGVSQPFTQGLDADPVRLDGRTGAAQQGRVA